MLNSEILDQYVTNTDDKVFAIHNLSGMVGAVMARYSRTEGGLRHTLANEFLKDGKLKVKRADKLIERVLIAYGDDSVGELEGAHLSMENISMLATKVIEHRRIGGSPIEQSTRYVRYDFKDEQTGYHYHVPESLKDEEQQKVFRHWMNRIFDAYAEMWSPLTEFLKQKKPINLAEYDLGDKGRSLSDMQNDKDLAVFQRTYDTDIKTKTCDILRAFLPLAAKANVGLFGNGRFYQHLITHLLTSNLEEANILGEKAFRELSKLIPHYVKRAKRNTYLVENRTAMDRLGQELFGDLIVGQGQAMTLIKEDADFLATAFQRDPSAEGVADALTQEQEIRFVASIVYAHVRGDFEQIRRRIGEFSQDRIKHIVDTYYGDRRTRRDRPERGIEFGYPYNFDVVTEWAVYKDLMRHRMGTVMIQPMAPDLGFEMPAEIQDAGLTEPAQAALDACEALYGYLAQQAPETREYAILQGHKVRWFLGMNDRALMHMLELRTQPQGHANYRRACQEMHELALQHYPDRARRMGFVSHDENYWSRADSEARQRVKEAKLEA